jgi:cephalosporin hydroxylase
MLNAKTRRCSSIQDYVDLSYGFHLGFSILHVSISPWQIRSELLQLAEVVDRLRPKAVLEIGTAEGGTFFLWCKLASEDATLISIDLPRGRFGGGYPEWKVPFYMKMAKSGQKVTLLREDSHEPATLKKIMDILNGHEIDFLFVDGDHSFEGVKRDFEMYSRFVRSGGIIALHDIVPSPIESGCEVSKFWSEVKTTYRHSEIVESYFQGRRGVGLLFI